MSGSDARAPRMGRVMRRGGRSGVAGSIVLWPREKTLSPSLLQAYTRCPFQARLQYIEDVQGRRAFNLLLAKRSIAHAILLLGAQRWERAMAMPDAAEIERLVRQRLRRREFPSPEEWETHVAEVVRWVRYGLAYLDPTVRVLRAEKPGKRLDDSGAGAGRVTLMTRPDLVLLRHDESGFYAEFVDYKTGKPRDDFVTPVLTRFVFRELLKAHFPNPTPARVVFTYLWLNAREAQQIELTLNLCHDHLAQTRASIQALYGETS